MKKPYKPRKGDIVQICEDVFTVPAGIYRYDGFKHNMHNFSIGDDAYFGVHRSAIDCIKKARKGAKRTTFNEYKKRFYELAAQYPETVIELPEFDLPTHFH